MPVNFLFHQNDWGDSYPHGSLPNKLEFIVPILPL